MPDQAQLPSLLYQVEPIQEASKAPIQYITNDIKAKANVEKYSQNYLDYIQTNQPNSLDAFKDNRIQLKKYNVDLRDVYDTLSDGSLVSRYKDFVVGTDNNERLAQQQTLTEKWGNGAAKLGIKTVTAVAGGTLGILDSLGTLMTTGSLSEAYNSNLNIWLDDFNKKVDYKLPNLYTQQDREAGLFGQMGQANFYADKWAGGFSFMAGAVISEAIWSAATAATFGGTAEILALNTAKQAEKGAMWATKAFGTENKLQKVLNTAKSWIKMPSTSVLDEAGNAMRGLTNAEKQSTILAYGIGKGADIIVPMMRSAGYESGMEARLYMKQTEENWLDKYKQTNGREPSSQEYADFKDKLSDSANVVFGANMAVLSLSNYAQLKNTILGKTTARTITNNAFSNSLFGKGFRKLEGGALEAIEATKAQKIFGRTYGLAKRFVAESQEEMVQSVFSVTGDNYMLAEFDKDKTKSTYGIMESFGDALHKTYTTKEGLTEGLIGGLIGIMGGVAGGARNMYKKDGKGERGNFFEDTTERKEIQNAVDYSNEFTAKNLAVNITTSNKMMKAQENKDQAERNNDVPAQKYAQTSMHIARIERDSQIGGIEEGKADYAREVNALDNDFLKEELGFTTNEEINAYKDQTIKDYNDASEKYTRNLRYSEALLGEKDSKMEEFKGVGIRTIHRAMAHTFTLGEVARETDNELTATINDELLKLSGVEGLTQANEVQHVLDNISKQKTEELGKLNYQNKALKSQLLNLEADLEKASKLKTETEDTSVRQNRLIDITTKIQETQKALALNAEQKDTAFAGLGIEQYTKSGITHEAFENHEKNVEKFNTFMNDLKLKNPEKYAKMVGLLAQKDKSIKHIKNYEKAVNLIVNKATRIKTVESWAKKTGLKTDPKQFYLSILTDTAENGAIFTENNRQQVKNREAFVKDEQSLENVAQSYIDKLLEQDYDGLLKIDQQIVDKYKGEEVASMEMPKEENTEKPVTQLQALKDKIKKLTSDVYTSQYIGDALEEQTRHKPKDSDVEEYENLLKKWNRKAEKSLAKIINRPSDYKYKNLGLNEAEIDRLKELNTTLGTWMSFVGTDAGNGESVADLLQRLNLLEQAVNTQETKTELSDKDIKLVIKATESEAKLAGNQYRGLQTQTDVLAIIKKKENTITFSHIKTKSLASIFPNSSMLINSNGTFEININGHTLTGKENSKGGQVIKLEDWNAFKKESNVLIKDFGNVYNAVSQFMGVDSQGNEQYKTLESDFTYDQLDGSSLKIDLDEVNATKKGDLVDLFISTQDIYNSKIDPKNTNSNLHIYAMRNGNLIGSVPAGYSDELPDGVGIPLRDLRKNSAEFIKNTGLKGLVKLPYKMEAGIIIIGTPYVTLQKDENGNVTTKQNEFTKESLQNVVGTGYSLNEEVFSKVNVDVKQFARKLGEENKDKKVPLIIANIEGKTIAFPVNLKSQVVDMSAPVIEANKLSDNDRLQVIIQTLLDNNIDPNSFGINFSSSDWTQQEDELANVLKALQNVVVYKDIDYFTSEKYNLNSLKDDATIAIELDKTPFASSKIMLKISSKLDTDVLGYRENLAKIEERRFATKTALNEVIKDIHFEFDKNLALQNFDNKFIDTLSENPLYGGTSDVVLSKNINTLKIAIKGMSQTTKKIVGAELIDNTKYLIKEIEFYNSEAKKTKTEIDNSEYYSDANQYFITVDENGELNNPNVLEAQVIQELGGIKNKIEFDEALQNSNFETLKNGTQLNLFEDLAEFERIPIMELVDGKLVNKKNDKVGQTIKVTLQDDENNVVRNALNALEIIISNKVWNSNPKNVKILLKNVEDKAIEISLDLRGLTDSYDTKTQTEIMDVIRALDFLLNNVNEQNLNHFVEVYENFMGVDKEDLILVEKVVEKFKNKPLVRVEGKESNYKLFKELGLLKINKNTYLKTDSTKMSLKDIENLMQVNNIEISKDDMIEQMSKEFTDDAEYSEEELKKLINYKTYFGTKSAKNEVVNVKVPQNIENKGYLMTDFIADVRKEQLQNPENKVLQNLEFSDKGILVKNTDKISLQELKNYLETDQNLKNYFLLNRNTNFEVEQSDNIIDERTQIVNGKILSEFNDNFRKINSQTVQARTNEDFIRIGKDNFEKISGDLFSKLPTNDSNFYVTDIEQPKLNVNPREYASQKILPKVEIKNKYSQKESEQIDNEIDCSK
jgi:hypothetical protein